MLRGDGDAWSQGLAAALQLAGRGASREAADLLARLIRERPAEAMPHLILATLWQQHGDVDAALREADLAARLAPADGRCAQLHGHLLLSAGRAVEAETQARRALVLAPGDAAAGFDLGCALAAQQRWNEAAEIFASLLSQAAWQAQARRMLARCHLMREDKASALQEALHPDVLNAVPLALAVAADFAARNAGAERIRLARALVARHPHDYACVLTLADALHADDRAGEALAYAERAHALQPQAAKPQQMRAISLIDRGDAQEGLAVYRQLVGRGVLDAIDEQRYLIVSHYDPQPDPASTFQAHTDWSRRHVQPFGAPFQRVAKKEHRLRVGWLSPRFSEGPVARFFTGLLQAFDREQHRHILISLAMHGDASTQTLHTHADEIIAAHGLDDHALLARLRDAKLDVLVDLAGHAPFSRPQVLAQRVAPVQLCWLDYFDTTALPNMDGWVSDIWLTPPESAQRFSERVLHLPGGRFCYTPPVDAPPASREGDGAPVFVSFNRIAKLHGGVLDAWAQILARVPQAQLRIGARSLDDPCARDYLLQRFAVRGVDAARLILHGGQSYGDLLQAYRHSDIALDAFPFSGCTTSCDALWMGLPVVTLPGWSAVSRQTASLLWRLDRPQWVASDGDEYVTRAVDLALRVESIRAERDALRREVAERLCDSRRQAEEFAALFARLSQGVI